MELNQIIGSNGATRPKKRVGKGEGNGHGKTCGRGQKGSKARSGYSVRPGFEGGQMPLYLKMPRRGFSNYRHQDWFELINVGDLSRFDSADTINLDLLKAKGEVQKCARMLKLLGVGEVDKAYTVEAHKASASAIEKIEKAGGKVILLSASEEQAS
jgi:large subunit ribosomal protein L15